MKVFYAFDENEEQNMSIPQLLARAHYGLGKQRDRAKEEIKRRQRERDKNDEKELVRRRG